MVNIWHILDYSYVVFCRGQDRLSHPKASCNICSVPFFVPNQLLKSNGHLISAILGLRICTTELTISLLQPWKIADNTFTYLPIKHIDWKTGA